MSVRLYHACFDKRAKKVNRGSKQVGPPVRRRKHGLGLGGTLAVAPAVFGPLGILMGMAAVSKGERYLGMLGLTASAVLAVTGYYIAGALIG